MIVQENQIIDGKEFILTYSDSNRYVVRDGVEYSEACDPAEFGREYTEGDLMEASEDEYAQAGRIMMGVEE